MFQEFFASIKKNYLSVHTIGCTVQLLLGMTPCILSYINAELTTADSQSDLRILL